MLGHTNVQTTQIYARITERKINQDMEVLSKKLDPQAGVYIMPESEYRARKARKLRQELQEFALSNGVVSFQPAAREKAKKAKTTVLLDGRFAVYRSICEYSS